MRALYLLLGFLLCQTIYSQNSIIYLKKGDKVAVEDNPVFYTWREGVYHNVQKKNGKFASSDRMDISKIEKLETINNVQYFTYRINEDAPLGFYKTLIKGKDKRLIVCFRPFGSDMSRLIINYTVIDDSNKEIVSGFFREHEASKQQEMFKIIKKHFPTCNEVLQSIEEYKDVNHIANFYTGLVPEGFTFQNKVFLCE